MKSKTLVQEDIPPGFAEAMKQVAALIEVGDDTVSIESDDLLQIGDVCGGLYSAAEQRFGFCVCCRAAPEDDEALTDEYGTIEWCFYLSKEEIAEIATGAVGRIKMWRCSAYDCGRRWSEPDGYCPRCDFLP
jgi:hypothetical protein